MARKMPRRLVALSSSAITAIYFAGFFATRAADAGIAAATAATDVPVAMVASPSPTAASAPTAVVSASLPTTTPTSATTTTTPGTTSAAPTAGATATSTAVATAAATASTAATSAYKDGTYTGTGTSRRGNVSVSVTVSSGRITNVTISNITTQYPVSRIASLPAQVVSRQNGQVDNISGATYSATAFRTAVQAALAQAGA